MPLLPKKELAAELKTPVTGVQALPLARKIPCLRPGHGTVRYDLAAGARRAEEIRSPGRRLTPIRFHPHGPNPRMIPSHYPNERSAGSAGLSTIHSPPSTFPSP